MNKKNHKIINYTNHPGGAGSLGPLRKEITKRNTGGAPKLGRVESSTSYNNQPSLPTKPAPSAPYAWSQQPRPAQLELGLPLAVVEEHLLPSGLGGDLGARTQAVPQVRRQHVVHLHQLAVHLLPKRRGVAGGAIGEYMGGASDSSSPVRRSTQRVLLSNAAGDSLAGSRGRVHVWKCGTLT